MSAPGTPAATPKPIRSPSYPNMALGDAIEEVAKIERLYRSSPVDRTAAAKLIGYTTLSGPANKALAALASYGLLDRAGKGETKVTERARDILHAENEGQRIARIREAALEPELFRELRERFQDIPVPPEDGVVTYLNRQGFNPNAVRPAAKAFLETMSYLEQLGGSESHSSTPDNGRDSTKKYGGAAVGDLVQWEADGTLQLEKAARVRAVQTHEGKEWVFVDGSETGIPMDQVIVEQKGQQGAGTGGAPTLALRDEPVRAGTRKEVFALEEGDVVVSFPDNLTEDSFSDLEAYLEVFLTKAARRAGISRTKPAASPMENPEVSYRRGFTHGAWNAWQAAQRDLSEAVIRNWIDSELEDWWHEAFERAKEGQRVFSGRPPMPDGMLFEKPKSES